jgi:hypothetical protein
MNLPFFQKKLKQISPRYIMNIAIRSKDLWFLYYYRGPRRISYDPKWFPRKPSKADGPIGVHMDRLKEDERDQLSYCAFGESSKLFFLRSTDRKKEWTPRLSRHVPGELLDAYQDEFKRGPPRAIKFGKGKTWILYGKSSFSWSRHGLPRSLQTALQRGTEERWTINVSVLSLILAVYTATQLTRMPQKTVLNCNNRKEYVLVFNEGPVYYSFHRDFVSPFKVIIEEWSSEMRSSERFPDHKPTFPSETHDDNDDEEEDSDLAESESLADDSGEGGDHISKQNRRAVDGRNRQAASSASNASAPEASGSSQRPRADSDDAVTVTTLRLLHLLLRPHHRLLLSQLLHPPKGFHLDSYLSHPSQSSILSLRGQQCNRKTNQMNDLSPQYTVQIFQEVGGTTEFNLL